MPKSVMIGDRAVGDGAPVYVIAEIGINHNGELATALELMKVAAETGCDAVKFQKRTPELCVPMHQRDIQRETPWGVMSYFDYKVRIEFGHDEYQAIAKEADHLGIQWFASPWDVDSVAFLEEFDPPCHKVASASITDLDLLRALRATGRPIIMSTGMSTPEEIRAAVDELDRDRLLLAHATSTYPCVPEELNLRVLQSLREEYDVPVGYSGHETGLQTTVATVALGACFVERHITLDRAMWGTDHAASIEPGGLSRLVRDIRVVQTALGDGVKKVYDSELPIRDKLRAV